MKIISWNINGIRAVHKKGLFLPFLKKYQPDILCLQETKAEQHQNPVELPEYEEYWHSAEKKGYSGTAIFTKIKPENVLLGFPKNIKQKFNLEDSYGDPNKEGRIITLEFKNLYVVSVYTPNAKDDLSRLNLRYKKWDPAFLAYVKDLESPSTGNKKGKPVIFCGDLNVAHTSDDLARPKENKGNKGFTNEEKEGIDNILNAGFIDTFRMFTSGNGHYTWWSHFAKARERNIGWRIDYIFTSKTLKNKIIKAEILPEVLGSDHCPVLLEIK